MIVEFQVDGVPVGKQRPRVTDHGTYTPQKTKNYEEFVKYCYWLKCRKKFPQGTPLKLTAVFYMPIPKSMSPEKRQEMDGKPYIKKKDVDNLVKSIMDGLNGIAYNDDSQIYDAHEIKLYGLNPRAEVRIEGEDETG